MLRYQIECNRLRCSTRSPSCYPEIKIIDTLKRRAINIRTIKIYLIFIVRYFRIVDGWANRLRNQNQVIVSANNMICIVGESIFNAIYFDRRFYCRWISGGYHKFFIVRFIFSDWVFSTIFSVLSVFYIFATVLKRKRIIALID